MSRNPCDMLADRLVVGLRRLEQCLLGTDLARTVVPLVRERSRPLNSGSSFARFHIAWLLIDAWIVATGFYVALVLRFLDNLRQDVIPYIPALNRSLLPLIIVYAVTNYLWGLHRRVWRYASAPEVIAVFASCAISTVTVSLADWLIGWTGHRPLPLSVATLGGFFTCTGMIAIRYRWRLASGMWRWQSRDARKTRALIYGAGNSGQHLARRLLTEQAGTDHEIVGFIDDDPGKHGLRVHNIPVLGTRHELERIVAEKSVDQIILAMSGVAGEQLRAIISWSQRTNAQIRIVPNWLESIDTSRPAPLLREVKVDDLLGRQRVIVDAQACSNTLKDKAVLVTGGAGSVGSELCRQIIQFQPARLLVLDNNESALHDLEIELQASCPNLQVTSLIGDVTDEGKMDMLFREMSPQAIFHAAAYKHVPLMERYPEEAVRVNVGGTLVMLDKARQYGAERFVLVSTDKAVNAESVMGATKRLAELLVLDAGHRGNRGNGPPSGELVCTAVRFGNVLGSRGSVVPTFAKQIEIGGPVTVTHPEMTRYFMEISEAAALIIQAAALTEGGEIFMLDMGERIRVDDLARKMIRLRGLRPHTDIPIVYVGIRPGEKLHEELIFPEEDRVPTAHPLIYRVSARAWEEYPDVDKAVRTLLKTCTVGGREPLVRELMMLSQIRNDELAKHEREREQSSSVATAVNLQVSVKLRRADRASSLGSEP